MQVQLPHDILAMARDRFRADHQGGGDLFIAHTLCKEREHFLFAVC